MQYVVVLVCATIDLDDFKLESDVLSLVDRAELVGDLAPWLVIFKVCDSVALTRDHSLALLKIEIMTLLVHSLHLKHVPPEVAHEDRI